MAHRLCDTMLARGSGSEGRSVITKHVVQDFPTSTILWSSVALNAGRVVTAVSSLPGGLALVTDSLLAELLLVALKLAGYGAHSA